MKEGILTKIWRVLPDGERWAWSDAIGIETVEECDVVSQHVCFLTRGWDNLEGARHICELHNDWVGRGNRRSIQLSAMSNEIDYEALEAAFAEVDMVSGYPFTARKTLFSAFPALIAKAREADELRARVVALCGLLEEEMVDIDAYCSEYYDVDKLRDRIAKALK